MAEFRLSNFTSGAVLTAGELNTGLTFADYTPTLTQSATITKTVNWARYTKFGKLVYGSIKLTASASGTANNKIIVDLPVSASSNNYIIGTMNYYDASNADANWSLNTRNVYYESSTTMSFAADETINTASESRWGQNYVNGSNTYTGFTIATGDIIFIQFQYEAS